MASQKRRHDDGDAGDGAGPPKVQDAGPAATLLEDTAQWLRVTLSSIGDGVITTDQHGMVTMLNPVAQRLTGWTQAQAAGRPLTEVFSIVNQDTRSKVENPALRALRDGVVVGLANHTILIAKDKSERNIDDSAAPIRNEKGETAGAVLVFRDITERYRQEQLVVDQREYAQNILSTLRHAFLVLDSELRVVTANNAFYTGFKLTATETEGRLVHELGGGAWNIPLLRAALERVLPENHSFEDFEVEHEFGNGVGRRVLALNARRVEKPENHSKLILLVIEDVTEQRDAIEVIRESKRRYQTLFESMDEGFCVIEVLFDACGKAEDYRFLEVNPAFETQSGLSDALGKTVREMVPEHEEYWYRIYGEVALTGEPVRMVNQAKALDGRWFDLNAFRLGGPESRRVAVLFKDITARRDLERNVRESEMRYRRLFQAAKDGILILDAKTGKITDANAFMGGLVGLEAHAMIGKELHEIGLFGDTEASKQAFRTLQENGYIRYEHLPVKNQMGGHVEVEVIANVYQEGQTLVAQCNVRDISQRVVMEQKIREQTAQIAGESVRKDEFLAMLSHELRNPLAPIRAAVHLMQSRDRGTEDSIQRQAREIIERQVGNLTKIVNDLLEVSRVVNGRVRLDLHVIDLNQVVRHAVETAMPLFEKHKHELVLKLSPEPIWTNVDATRMEEVFINLLNNAGKYTPDGGKIEVTCERVAGSNRAEFRVRDNGVGIEAKLLPRIFDLFTQGDRSLARSAGGLGIGLSLAQRLVELHGGKIEAHSPPSGSDIGTEVVVRLSVMAAPGVGEVPREQDDVQAAGEAGRVRALLVDDNVDLVLILASLLQEQGYAVRTAYNGLDGLKAAQQWRPDVVLLDIGLPGLDGYEVARRLRAGNAVGAGGAAVRVIALTGYGRDSDVALAREAGFDGHLTKPVDFKELEKMMAGPTGPA